MRRHGFGAGDIAAITALVPPKVHWLVGRPDLPEPPANYAKLCLRFVAGGLLARGTVDVPDFRGAERLGDPAGHRHAGLVDVVLDDNSDQSALDPQTISVCLTSGASHRITLPDVYGHPAVPLTKVANGGKFRRCPDFAAAPLAAAPLSPGQDDALIAAVNRLENMMDVSALMPLMCRGRA